MSENIFEIWARKTPGYDAPYQELFDVYCNYGKGADSSVVYRGKTFGGAYELYLIAFFLGLYADKTAEPYHQEKKVFGYAVGEWGHPKSRSSVQSRKDYSKIVKYIFAALLAKTDVDYEALEKGEIKPEEVADSLMKKMEKYAAFGLRIISEESKQNPKNFMGGTAFFDLFQFSEPDETDSVGPEPF